MDVITKNGKLVAKTWCPIDKLEASALVQILKLADHPFLFNWAAIMPDAHQGKGATIGSVIPMEEVVIPAAVGFDINCGVVSFKTSLKLGDLDDLPLIDKQIRRSIPLGMNRHGKVPYQYLEDKDDLVRLVNEAEDALFVKRSESFKQLGTLGGGNHFIELQKDDDDNIYVMIHSGSRHFGKTIAEKFMKNAKNEARKYRLDIPDDLEFLHVDSDLGRAYLHLMKAAMEFGYANRMYMVHLIQDDLKRLFPGIQFANLINIAHNYVALEHHYGRNVWVHRKGATRVTPNTVGLVPGSMGTSSYIVKGTGNKESYNSCSHGAGRVLSRTAAKGKWDRRSQSYITDGALSIEDFRDDMASVYTQNIDRHHLDESPQAYKNIDEVMEHQSDLVVKVLELKPILNIKG